jgi:sugar O-acyltransferase (sialic acid O-acetyltransferase NeuD family)
MISVVLIGGGGHAKVVAAIVGKTRGCRIIGYTAPVAGPAPLNLSYLGDDSVLPDLVASERVTGAVIGVGIIEINDKRATLHRSLSGLGFSLPSIVSPTAVVNEQVAIGDGTVIMDGAVINSGASIGELSIVNTNATVEHDCIIGAYSHIAPGAVLCGGVTVGDQAMIGASACVLPGVRIADRCLVGGGATVTRNLTEPGVYLGTPARRMHR